MLEQKRRRFVVIREELLSDARLTVSERLVCARISAFEEYFESADECAKLLGISASTVQKAKAKLERLGYIICLADTGRGKTYRAVLDYEPDEQNLPTRLAKSANQVSKICQYRTNRDENIELDTNVSKEQAPSEYGNESINRVFQAWQDAGLPAITSRMQANRRAVWNMLRNKSVGESRLMESIELVAKSQSDPYAPSVPDLETLPRRLGALEVWRRRQQAKVQEAQAPVEPVYQRRTYDERPAILDYESSDEIVSDEFLEQCRKNIRRKEKQ